jgi:hypothetical protein
MKQLLEDMKKVAESEGYQPTLYGVSKLTGISEATLSRWNAGKVRPNSDQCAIIANTLGMELSAVEIGVALSFVKHPTTRKVWEQLAGKLAATSASLAFSIFPSNGDANSHTAPLMRSSPTWSKLSGVEANTDASNCKRTGDTLYYVN